jgi:molybdenum cofactor biosynthesis enzyme MoaA
MILTERCNFKCPYCRGLQNKGDMPLERAYEVLDQWLDQGLKNIRFSGGEPMVYPHLSELVEYCAWNSVEHIAVSTNGSYPFRQYLKLVDAGVNDFSISLDACCASEGGLMAGTSSDVWTQVVFNIQTLSALTYVTVGVVVTEQNASNLLDIVMFAHSLGVADIRIITAAQYNKVLEEVVRIPEHVLQAHPILKYRVENILDGRNVRGLQEYDTQQCFLPLDDSVVCGDDHYPCVIYMREQGAPIGKVGPNMRAERLEWCKKHQSHLDPICKKNCLDVCIDHNNCCQHLEQP